MTIRLNTAQINQRGSTLNKKEDVNIDILFWYNLKWIISLLCQQLSEFQFPYLY